MTFTQEDYKNAFYFDEYNGVPVKTYVIAKNNRLYRRSCLVPITNSIPVDEWKYCGQTRTDKNTGKRRIIWLDLGDGVLIMEKEEKPPSKVVPITFSRKAFTNTVTMRTPYGSVNLNLTNNLKHHVRKESTT